MNGELLFFRIKKYVYTLDVVEIIIVIGKSVNRIFKSTHEICFLDGNGIFHFFGEL